MSKDHGTTIHPEWYGHAPLNHPVVAQGSFECFRCGSLVLELPAHDRFHEAIDALISPTITDDEEPSSPAADDAPATGDRHSVRVTEPAENKIVPIGSPRRSKPRGSSAGAPSPS